MLSWDRKSACLESSPGAGPSSSPGIQAAASLSSMWCLLLWNSLEVLQGCSVPLKTKNGPAFSPSEMKGHQLWAPLSLALMDGIWWLPFSPNTEYVVLLKWCHFCCLPVFNLEQFFAVSVKYRLQCTNSHPQNYSVTFHGLNDKIPAPSLLLRLSPVCSSPSLSQPPCVLVPDISGTVCIAQTHLD